MKEFLIKRYPRSRQPLARKILAWVTPYRHGERTPWHQHEYGQLAFALRGVIRLLTPTRTWTLPPSRAIWLPSDIDHEQHAVGDSEVCNVYIEPDVFPWTWTKPAIVAPTSLIRDLAVTLSAGGSTYAPDSREALSGSLLLKMLADLRALPESGVPLPRDERLLKICEHMMNDPSSERTLDSWGAQLGATGRTLSTHFKAETGLTFGMWQRQLRVAEAITRLATGHSVRKVSDELGYSTPSAFIAMFRKVTGESPQRYLESR